MMISGLRNSDGGGNTSSHLGRLNLTHRGITLVRAQTLGSSPITKAGGLAGDRQGSDNADDLSDTGGRQLTSLSNKTTKTAGVAVKSGIVAATRRHAAQRAAAKAGSASAKVGAAAAKNGAAAASQAVSGAGRLITAAISALSSTPGLIAAIVAVAVAAAIMAVLSIIPGIGSAEQQQTITTVTIPAEYLDAVNRAGSICTEITPGLIAAQINHESSWNPKAVSPVGAQGISQFMPGTWASVGVDGDGDGKADVWNATDAIITQGHFMCGLVDQVKKAKAKHKISGDTVSLALAAYNAGFGAVLKAKGVPAFTESYIAAILADTPSSSADEGTSADLTAAVAWAKAVAADDTYRYVWGGNGRQDGGYDCSGLSTAMYKRLGIKLPRTAAAQQVANIGTTVKRNQLKVGDLMFWRKPAYHVAIYAGDGWMVSADDPVRGILYERIWGTPSSYRRIIQ